MIELRPAGVADLALVLPRTRALNDHEGIAVSDADLTHALGVLLGDASLGAVWLIERAGGVIGYAIATYCYDLEFGGREAWLTEIWIDEPARGGGAGREALALVEAALRARGVRALHLQVRADNPAARLYARMGFTAVPRTIMSRRL